MYFQTRMRPDFHRCASAVVDWLERRLANDIGRLGVLGRSLDGFYALHSAARGPRFKVCIAWGVLFDLSYYDTMAEPGALGFADVAGYADRCLAALYLKQTLNLAGTAERVHCCRNLYHIVRPRMADWAAERLGGGL